MAGDTFFGASFLVFFRQFLLPFFLSFVHGGCLASQPYYYRKLVQNRNKHHEAGLVRGRVSSTEWVAKKKKKEEEEEEEEGEEEEEEEEEGPRFRPSRRLRARHRRRIARCAQQLKPDILSVLTF